jgi:hypothetical protein
MPHDEKPGGGPTVPQGLAGGPGPSPPGVDDGTPKVATEGSEGLLPEPADEGTVGRRSARAEGAAARGDPEEPDPS